MLLGWDRLSLIPDRSPVWNARLYAGLSHEELAHQVGVTRQTISLIERRLSAPSSTIALALARVLDATVEELFSASELD